MCIFSVGKLFCTCGAGDDASYARFGETKDKYFNRSLRHGTETCVLIRFGTYGSIGTGAVLVPGFGTQPYLYYWPILDECLALRPFLFVDI